MAIYWPTPGFKGRRFKLGVLTKWDFNFCVRSSGKSTTTHTQKHREHSLLFNKKTGENDTSMNH